VPFAFTLYVRRALCAESKSKLLATDSKQAESYSFRAYNSTDENRLLIGV
jgi:hypothetical protein|tara:strand:- start:348 stop:497 length:150 start_codon:yes stop_codon:yes gene_type:complete